MSRIVVVSNPLSPDSFFEASYVRRPTDPNATMTFTKITRESCLGSVEVAFPDRSVVRYHLFTALYNSRDCYYFLTDGALAELPTDRLGVQRLSDLGVYCENWDFTVKNREDERFRATIVRAFRDLLTVEEVHAL